MMKDEQEFPLLAMVPMAMMLLDEGGCITHANELAQAHMGTSLRRLQGKSLAAFLQPTSEVEVMIGRAMAGETLADDAFCGRQNHIPYSIHFGPMMNRKGVVVALIPEANRSEVEEHTHRHEMAEAIARIALEMAHEVKNPLAGLRGAAQLLHEQLIALNQTDAREITEHILSEVDRIKDRIDTFLQVGPRADVAMSQVNIHALLDDVCLGSDGVHVNRSYDPSLPEIPIHESRFRQAIENLWINAVEAGSTVVTWETRVAPLVALPGHTGMVMELSMRSNGNTIPDEMRARLFEPYVSGKARGSGLGLAIVQRVVQEHGGRVALKSTTSDTVFVIHLPIQGGK